MGLALPPKKSGIRNLPLPPTAVAEPALSAPGREVYRVPDVTPPVVASFYDSRSEDRRPFEGLSWCSRRRLSTQPVFWEWTWQAPGTQDYVVVQVTRDDKGTLLTIIDAKSDAARTCG